jgi:phosphate-selective porin OprO/OprP
MTAIRVPFRAALFAGAALVCLAAGPALAQDDVAQATAAPEALPRPETADERIARLEAALADLQGQLADLKASTGAQVAQVREAQQATVVTLNNGRPGIASGDGKFSANIRGMVQLDGAIYDQDSAGPLATDFRRGSFNDTAENDRARDLGDGFNFRRVRLGVEGKAFGDWQYNITVDFGGSGNEEGGKINAAWLQYDGLGWGKVRVGAFAPTTGLEDGASNTSSLFAERAAIAEVVRGLAGGDGRVALQTAFGGERWTLTGALTGNVIQTQTYDEQVGFVGRATWTPYKRPDSLLHLGLNTNIIIDPAATGPDVPGGAVTNIRLRERPEIRVDGTRLIDTGNIDAENAYAFGGEFGYLYKNLYVQAEYFNIDVERRTGTLPDPSFSGWYIQGSWILTGESRRYSANSGFDGPRPDKPFNLATGDWGAWELGLRYSTIDLNSRENDLPADGSIRGGEQDIFSVGLNWYPNTNVMISGTWRNVSVDRTSPGGTAFGGAFPATPPLGVQVGQDLNIYSLRTQYAF